jgi:hypothetical protein
MDNSDKNHNGSQARYACTTCQRLKKKCDRNLPECSLCLRYRPHFFLQVQDLFGYQTPEELHLHSSRGCLDCQICTQYARVSWESLSINSQYFPSRLLSRLGFIFPLTRPSTRRSLFHKPRLAFVHRQRIRCQDRRLHIL